MVSARPAHKMGGMPTTPEPPATSYQDTLPDTPYRGWRDPYVCQVRVSPPDYTGEPYSCDLAVHGYLVRDKARALALGWALVEPRPQRAFSAAGQADLLMRAGAIVGTTHTHRPTSSATMWLLWCVGWQLALYKRLCCERGRGSKDLRAALLRCRPYHHHLQGLWRLGGDDAVLQAVRHLHRLPAPPVQP